MATPSERLDSKLETWTDEATNARSSDGFLPLLLTGPPQDRRRTRNPGAGLVLVQVMNGRRAVDEMPLVVHATRDRCRGFPDGSEHLSISVDE